MDAKVLIAILLVVAVVVAVALFLRQTRRKHPEQTATHQRADQGEAPAPPSMGTQRYPGVDRPAGPGAESMDPDLNGSARSETPRPRS